MAETAASMAIATQSAQNGLPNFEGATTGATFPKLPFELRSRIWRYSFPPPRTIRLAADEKPEFPVTLWINYESRTETLKYYVLFHNEMPWDSRLSWVRCFSPSRDIASIDGGCGLSYLSFLFVQWLDNMESIVGGLLATIQRLEVTGIPIGTYFGLYWRFNHLKEVLPSFPGLKEITFVGPKCDTYLRSENVQQIERHKQDINRFFADNIRCLPLAQGLKILFVDFEPRK